MNSVLSYKLYIITTNLNPLLPEQYWLSLKKGDATALEFLYQKYANSLYNYGSKFTADKDLIKENIQELFITLWTRKSSLGEPANVKNYLFKAFRLSIFKKVNKNLKYDSLEENAHYDFDASLTIEETIITGESNRALQQRLQTTLNQLTDRQREAIFLKFYEELSYDEIAEIMNISVKGTYKVVARAMEALREKLSREDFLMLLLLLSAKLFA